MKAETLIFLLVIFGTIFYLFFYKKEDENEASKIVLTKMQLESIKQSIMLYQHTFDEYPKKDILATLDGRFEKGFYFSGSTIDSWDNDFDIKYINGSYHIASAGPDKDIDTEDDLVLIFTPKK